MHHRSGHHAAKSGYARLIDYLEGEVVLGKPVLPYKLARLLSRLYPHNAGLFNAGSVLKEVELFKLLRQQGNEKTIVHYLNAERDIGFLVKHPRLFKNARFTATFHKPPEILKTSISHASHLKKLKGALAVGSNQVDFLKEWLQLEKVIYIPHGVDTRFFVPDASKRKENNLLFVGQHLRDFDTFNRCIPGIADKITGLKVNVVIHPAYINKIKPHPSISQFTEVNDEALRNFYNEATLLFLPMLDVTACNSILEALACGLPIVTNDVGGNKEYLANTESILAPPGDDGFITEVVISLLKDEAKLKQMAVLSREKALGYEWAEVAKRVKEFYNSLL